MKFKKLGIENGKFVLREPKREYPTTIIKNVTYNNKYFDLWEIEVKEPGDFEFGYCGYCGSKFKHEDQLYCEKCGHEL